ncbi:hypothetical protein HFO28_13710 [Rhizobium leguminosarum]|uniref:hypothetical protein n=1 Tax=Rhizobium leguminosarum TaxID=384 RepID=UPI001C97BF7E|nr:hypothetical protein [Rhizobium leguminosarum]MBY5744641.1 hypothetical protein [Rhizobium leguminosarum]
MIKELVLGRRSARLPLTLDPLKAHRGHARHGRLNVADVGVVEEIDVAELCELAAQAFHQVLSAVVPNPGYAVLFPSSQLAGSIW